MTPSSLATCSRCLHLFARDRHRALADCVAGVWLLPQTLPGTERPVLAELRERALTEALRLWAVGAPIAAKAELRARGYFWMPETRAGIARSWWTDLGTEMLEPELEWLEETYSTYRDPFRVGFKRENIPVARVTAYDRWRANPADIAGSVAWGDAPASPSVRSRSAA